MCVVAVEPHQILCLLQNLCGTFRQQPYGKDLCQRFKDTFKHMEHLFYKTIPHVNVCSVKDSQMCYHQRYQVVLASVGYFWISQIYIPLSGMYKILVSFYVFISIASFWSCECERRMKSSTVKGTVPFFFFFAEVLTLLWSCLLCPFMVMEARVGGKERRRENNLPWGSLHLRPHQSPEIKIPCWPVHSLPACPWKMS